MDYTIAIVLCVHTHMCLLQTGRPVWYTHAHFQNSMLNVQKLHVLQVHDWNILEGLCFARTFCLWSWWPNLGTWSTQVNTELCCVWYLPVLVRYHTHTKVVHEGIKIYYGHIHVKEVQPRYLTPVNTFFHIHEDQLYTFRIADGKF